MKRVLSILLLFTLVCTAVACGATTPHETTDPATTAEEIPTEAPTEKETTEEETTEAVPAVTTITVASYNVRHGDDVEYDWSKLAEVILQSGADVVGLQEIDMNTGRNGGRDTMAGLSEATGFPYYVFIPAMNFDGGQYGTAILSRYPILSSDVITLNAGGYEPRALGAAEIELPDGSTLHFLNTHLAYEDDFVRSTQFTQVAKWIKRNIRDDSPVMITGDFNTADFSDYEPLEKQGFAIVNNAEHSYPTYRGNNTPIDNVVYLTSRLTPVEHDYIDSSYSDHNLLWCRFEIK